MKRRSGIRSGHRARRPRWGIALFLCAAGLLAAGCGGSDYDPALLKEAAALGEEQEWARARPLIKAHLLKYPDDTAGHFYYGLSYLHLKHAQLTIAEGELLTAQTMLSREDPRLEAATGMEYYTFKGVLHQKTALVYMRAFREVAGLRVPYKYTRDLLVKAANQVDMGLQSNPKSHILEEYREFLEETLHGTPEQLPEVMTRAAGEGSPI